MQHTDGKKKKIFDVFPDIKSEIERERSARARERQRERQRERERERERERQRERERERDRGVDSVALSVPECQCAIEREGCIVGTCHVYTYCSAIAN
jgi:septal ring factor EnvC (AmiA/AmiB activator)